MINQISPILSAFLICVIAIIIYIIRDFWTFSEISQEYVSIDFSKGWCYLFMTFFSVTKLETLW
jgi:hypothetical protein